MDNWIWSMDPMYGVFCLGPALSERLVSRFDKQGIGSLAMADILPSRQCNSWTCHDQEIPTAP